MPKTAKKTVPKGQIARRLILALVLFSSLITAITTAEQLFVDYRRGVTNIERSFSLVESGYLDGLTNSMWTFDDAQIKILMAGMAKLPDMEFITIKVDGKAKWSVGQRVSENVLTTDFPMQLTYRGEQWTIGVLTVVASLSTIFERLQQDVVVILISNAVKTFFVVGFVFVVFHRIVTRRLVQLLAAIKKFDLDVDAVVDLQSVIPEARKNPDEIDEIGIALRDMQSDLLSTHRSVREREHQLGLITDNLPGSVIHVGMDQCYKFVNNRTEIWLARPAEEIIGQPVRTILGEELYAKFRSHIEGALEGQVQEFEETVTYLDGVEREMEITYIPQLGRNGNVAGYFALALDVSDRHALEDRLRQSQKMEAVGQLTGGIAHEFNNLLQVVSGNLELLEVNIEVNSDADAGRRFDAIHRNVHRGAELTDRLLSFSRRQPLAPRAVDIDRTLTAMQGMLAQTLGETIHVDIVPADDIWSVRADPGQLENALLNLALNARDAMPSGGKISLSAANVSLDEPAATAVPAVSAVSAATAGSAAAGENRRAGDFVEICVRDSGGGMSEDEIERAFEPFFTTKDVGKGTGLGLSMVYGFAQQSGGFAQIESKLGQGTAVRLFLPRLVASNETASDSSPAPSCGGSPEKPPVVNGNAAGNTVLLVEDDPDVREALRDQISNLGYNVVVATDGSDALSRTGHGQPIDLLFTDIVMPGGLNGLELARQLRGRLPMLNVIYTTGYSDDIVAQSGQLEEGALLLRKPYDGNDLSDALSRSFGH